MSDITDLIEQLASTTVEETEKEVEVSFANRSLKLDTENDAEDIVKAIDACPEMTTLRLEGNTFGVAAAKAISKALESRRNFRKALWKDIFTQRTVEEIPEALNSLSAGIMLANAKLVHLDLSDNAFGYRGLIGIVKLLESSSCYTLQELHLNNNGLGIQGAKMLADALCRCLENSENDGCRLSLKVFVCGRNRLENEGASAMANFFKKLGTLRSVTMFQNGIYAPGIKNLADAFSVNSELQVINLEDNSLTAEGAKYIANCLQHLKKLKILNLGDCLVRTDGALHLANALKMSCPDLRELHLGYNEIKMSGGIAIVESVQGKTNFNILVLNSNHFGKEGCEIIKKKMLDQDMLDKLGTLSSDEGDDDEEEEENDQDTESDSSDNKNSSVEIEQNYKSPLKKINLGDFILKPTSAALIALHTAKEDLLSSLPSEPSLEDYLDLFSKICSVVKPNDDNTRSAACAYASDILPKAMELCSDNIVEFNNSFMVSLGFIKGEGKKPPRGVDITGELLVLQYVIKQPYFHPSTKDLIKFFLSQPFSYVTASEKVKHTLMQILYQT